MLIDCLFGSVVIIAHICEGLVHPKRKILPSFTLINIPCVVPNPQDFHSSSETQMKIFIIKSEPVRTLHLTFATTTLKLFEVPKEIVKPNCMNRVI